LKQLIEEYLAVMFLLHKGRRLFYLVPIQKRFFCPISALCSKFYPRNINYMPAVTFFACLDLEQKSSFLDGHYLVVFTAVPKRVYVKVKHGKTSITKEAYNGKDV